MTVSSEIQRFTVKKGGNITIIGFLNIEASVLKKNKFKEA